MNVSVHAASSQRPAQRQAVYQAFPSGLSRDRLLGVHYIVRTVGAMCIVSESPTGPPLMFGRRVRMMELRSFRPTSVAASVH